MYIEEKKIKDKIIIMSLIFIGLIISTILIPFIIGINNELRYDINKKNKAFVNTVLNTYTNKLNHAGNMLEFIISNYENEISDSLIDNIIASFEEISTILILDSKNHIIHYSGNNNGILNNINLIKEKLISLNKNDDNEFDVFIDTLNEKN